MRAKEYTKEMFGEKYNKIKHKGISVANLSRVSLSGNCPAQIKIHTHNVRCTVSALRSRQNLTLQFSDKITKSNVSSRNPEEAWERIVPMRIFFHHAERSGNETNTQS